MFDFPEDSIPVPNHNGATDANAQIPAPPVPLDDHAEFLKKFKRSTSSSPVAGARKIQTATLVKRPADSVWFQAHPDKSLWIDMDAIKADMGEILFVAADNEELYRLLERKITTYKVIPVIHATSNEIHFMPVSMRLQNGTLNSYHASLLEIAEHATTRWTRIESNQTAKGYDRYEPEVEPASPVWPSAKEVMALMVKAVKQKSIDNVDHPFVKAIRGA